MAFELTILGSSAAIPAHGRHLSAQVLQAGGELFLIDCGEGTQIQLMDYKIKFSKINHIFISHLHGDHIFGLMGLIMTYDLMGRTAPLHIYSPKGLEDFIKTQLYSGQRYPLYFHSSDTTVSTLLYENNYLEVYSIPLIHRDPCHGFLFVEKKKVSNIIKEKIEVYNIPYQQINKIKEGADFLTEKGELIPNIELTIPAPNPLKFAYCSDTMYSEEIIPLIKEVDLLYHEATFMQNMLEQAQKTMHSTAAQAASIAQQAQAKKLIIGHFSARYINLKPLLEEAKAVFDSTFLAEEGLKILVH